MDLDAAVYVVLYNSAGCVLGNTEASTRAELLAALKKYGEGMEGGDVIRVQFQDD